jgi:hypothetical protein
MKRLLLLVLLLPSLAGAARPIRLCTVGDSLTEAFFSSATTAKLPWPARLVSRQLFSLNLGVKNVADSGDTVADARVVFDAEVRGRGCTHVAFLIGTNDLAVGTAAATIYASTMTMATVAQAEGARVLLLLIVPRGNGAGYSADLETRRGALNELFRDAGSTDLTPGPGEHAPVVVDTDAGLADGVNPEDLAAAYDDGDGLHLSGTILTGGHERVAFLVQEAVVAAGGWFW